MFRTRTSATRWASDAAAASGVRWSYLRVDEELFDRHAADLRSVRQLRDLVHESHRQDYLRSVPPPRRRSREELLAMMDAISERVGPVTDLDEEISRFRDDPRG
jgi:type III restriction enzyme